MLEDEFERDCIRENVTDDRDRLALLRWYDETHHFQKEAALQWDTLQCGSEGAQVHANWSGDGDTPVHRRLQDQSPALVVNLDDYREEADIHQMPRLAVTTADHRMYG